MEVLLKMIVVMLLLSMCSNNTADGKIRSHHLREKTDKRQDAMAAEKINNV